MEAKPYRPSEGYYDALGEAVDEWFDKNLSPEEASRLKEQFMDADDTLFCRLVELCSIEVGIALKNCLETPSVLTESGKEESR